MTAADTEDDKEKKSEALRGAGVRWFRVRIRDLSLLLRRGARREVALRQCREISGYSSEGNLYECNIAFALRNPWCSGTLIFYCRESTKASNAALKGCHPYSSYYEADLRSLRVKLVS